MISNTCENCKYSIWRTQKSYLCNHPNAEGKDDLLHANHTCDWFVPMTGYDPLESDGAK